MINKIQIKKCIIFIYQNWIEWKLGKKINNNKYKNYMNNIKIKNILDFYFTLKILKVKKNFDIATKQN